MHGCVPRDAAAAASAGGNAVSPSRTDRASGAASSNCCSMGVQPWRWWLLLLPVDADAADAAAAMAKMDCPPRIAELPSSCSS